MVDTKLEKDLLCLINTDNKFKISIVGIEYLV